MERSDFRMDFSAAEIREILHATKQADFARTHRQLDNIERRLRELNAENAALQAQVDQLTSQLIYNADGTLWTCKCHYCQGHGDWCVCGCGADDSTWLQESEAC